MRILRYSNIQVFCLDWLLNIFIALVPAGHIHCIYPCLKFSLHLFLMMIFFFTFGHKYVSVPHQCTFIFPSPPHFFLHSLRYFFFIHSCRLTYLFFHSHIFSLFFSLPYIFRFTPIHLISSFPYIFSVFFFLHIFSVCIISVIQS